MSFVTIRGTTELVGTHYQPAGLVLGIIKVDEKRIHKGKEMS